MNADIQPQVESIARSLAAASTALLRISATLQANSQEAIPAVRPIAQPGEATAKALASGPMAVKPAFPRPSSSQGPSPFTTASPLKLGQNPLSDGVGRAAKLAEASMRRAKQ